jgi:molybdate transport system substrate-binding protein
VKRRSILVVLPLGCTALFGAARPATAQHHTVAPAAPTGDGQAVLVFAAATLKSALDPIVAAFRAKAGGEVTIAYGPSPALAKQIENGAPADLFVSADPLWMDYLAEHRLIRRHTRTDLVGNALVVVVRASDGAAGPPAVLDKDYPLAQLVGSGPLAMCNPADHPAGRYGKAGLEALGLWAAVEKKVAIADNPQVAVTMVARGNVPVAIVFATDVKGVPGARIAATFPESHPPIVYPAALTMAAPHAEAAEKLLAYLRSPEGRTQFDSYGYK